MKEHTKITYNIFWQHAMKYKLSFFTMVFSIVIGDIFAVLAPYWYKKFFDILPLSPDTNDLMRIVYVILLLSFFHWIFIRIAAFAHNHFQTHVISDLSNTCFAYLHKHSFSFFNNNFVGSLVKRVNRFSGAFQGVVDRLTWDLLPIIVNVSLIIVVLSTRSLLLGMILLVWIILFTTISYVFSRYKLRYDIVRAELDSKTTAILADSIANHINVKLWGGYAREKKLFADFTDQLRRLRKFTWDLNALFDSVQWGLMIVLEFMMLYIGIKLWQQQILTIGDFVLIQSYLGRIFEKLWGFGRVIRDFYENMAEAKEMTEILNTPHEIIDVRNAKDLMVTRGEIIFDKVNFSYHKTRRIIEKMNVKIESHQKVALVGPSGAGKSTIVKLLLRQHDISSGKILIDDQKISHVTQESLWQNISLVPQDPILFHRTLIENIRYGKPDATDEEVIEAAKQAHCHEFIQNFPEKYETFVGERGVKLSGGERQRVAIARAILRNAPILVLDEATSSLDSESEHLIQDALDTLMQGKTVIVIAHRLSTIMRMDRIIVIDDGGIIEDGTHAELLKKKKSMYKNLWHLQAGGFIE